MTNHLTIAYMTSRREPMIQWFFDSLNRECGGNYDGLLCIVVDLHAPRCLSHIWTSNETDSCKHIPPKPTVWQGPHRLTNTDYFAAANARNTAVCLAPDGWIVFVDDLSVLMPDWLASVRQAMSKGYIVCGAYKKVLALVVENGEAVCWREHRAGLDTRWNMGRDDGPVPLSGGAMYGCSVAMPVEALLEVNGFDEDADCCGMGGEDYICGMMLEAAGHRLMYDRRMLTLESEERHHWEPPLKRVIEKKDGDPLDASWALLNPVIARKRLRAPNYFGEEGIRGLRERVLRGEPFPVMKVPEHSWYSGVRLCEL